MIPRRRLPEVTELLADVPAVVLTGPRQVGKTTLARQIMEGRPAVYLDLESDEDLRRLADPESYLPEHEHELVVLDEVHRLPGLFRSLRGLIDDGLRHGLDSGRFLLLGSASIDLLKQSGESLAGRVSYVDLDPLDALEVSTAQRRDHLWVRGGFPKSLLAADDARSARWRQDFIRTYLEHDIPEFGPRIPATTLRRLWTMLSHQQGATLNAALFARNLGIDGKTVARYVDLLVDLLLVRQLTPWHRSTGKRMVKTPKVYVRDSGLVHTLLNIPDKESLLAHPVVGHSWEGHVIENILRLAGDAVVPSFYRSASGAEVDLVLEWRGGETWAVEVKRAVAPKLERGFYEALRDIKPDRAYVVYGGERDSYPISHEVRVIGLPELCEEILRMKPY